MNTSLSKLNQICNKEERLIIGLMSGTSLDGLDIALCKISNAGKDTRVKLLAFETVPYQADLKNKIKEICFRKEVDLEQVCLMNKGIAEIHAQLVNQFLSKNGYDKGAIDLIASHGQTIYHAPARLRAKDEFGNATLQIGDGDYIATQTGIITISDFRQKSIAQGNEGAPLALYGDYLLFNNSAENRILLNIGGISNLTNIPKGAQFSDVLSTDLGPGNTMMDQFVQQNFKGKYFDDFANIALKGVVCNELLSELLNHEFFTQDLPKSTGPELFNISYLERSLNRTANKISLENVMATLNRFTATSISLGVQQFYNINEKIVIYVSGGGSHNPLLMKNLESMIPNAKFKDTSALGIDPDAKEAILFALLANETVSGGYSVFGAEVKSMGKISLPN
ncbi:MAG: anhydro-N-acetylmuramic acid kinase [Pelobium sp.]